jgi:hypothetical protein
MILRIVPFALLTAACTTGGATSAGDGGGSRADSSMEAGADARVADARTATTDSSVAPSGSVRAFYFGHSLVGRDMPNMVGSFAASNEQTWMWKGQLGWGTRLEAHWTWGGDWNGAPNGFSGENRFDNGDGTFSPRNHWAGEGKGQLETGSYDVVVLTEVNGAVLEDPQPSITYATNFARLAREHNPEIRVILYANWLGRDEGGSRSLADWQARCDSDLAWWEAVADGVDANLDGPDISVLPGAKILAQVTREVESGRIGDLSVDDLFNDNVHPSQRGLYPIGLAHYSTIFRRPSAGLTTSVSGEMGAITPTVSAATAAVMQDVVDTILSAYPRAHAR